MAMMISSAPAALGLPVSIQRIARFIDLPNTVLAWLFVLAVMNDDFRFNRLSMGMVSVFCVTVWFLTINVETQWVADERPFVLAINLYALGLFLFLMVNVIKNRKDDLVESRRRLRWLFILAVISLVGLTILSEVGARFISADIRKSFKVIIALILVIAGHYWFLKIPKAHIAFGQKEGLPDLVNLSALGATEKEQAQIDKLNAAMDSEKLWQDETLSLETLARHLGVSTKRLRFLINQNLGFRNFRTYLQSYRLKAAKEDLANPAKRDVTILEIALNAGFNSISTFNRVFKQAEGISPKAYRAKASRA